MSGKCDPGCGLDRFPQGHPETSEADRQRMMAALYRAGFGYHAIADLAGIGHEDMRDLLLRNFPAVPEFPHWPG